MLKLHDPQAELASLTNQHMLTLAIVMRDKLNKFIGRQASTEPTEPFEALASDALNEALCGPAMAEIMARLLAQQAAGEYDSDDIGRAADSLLGAELF